MAYALLQKELLPPTVDQLKRAFSVWPALTEIDAQTAANDAFGVLLKGLELEQANLLHDSLNKESVETEVVKESDLPAIPPAKVVKQIEFMATHLSMFDPMKRHIELAWDDLALIAAGNVRLPEMRRVKTSHGESQVPGAAAENLSVAKSKEEAHYHLMLELILLDGAGRYSITADDFDFDCLGSKVTANREENFTLLVWELEHYAPYVSLNQGAYLICKESQPPFKYPSKAAFWEELTWMLWRIAQAKKSESGESSPEAAGL
jgi:hypothetical protein